ncbi:MAG: hypothetical protein FJ299_10040 [Planctomycetes bacterium]|nr:hypothetical protein [Planctomycetota bacterium]
MSARIAPSPSARSLLLWLALHAAPVLAQNQVWVVDDQAGPGVDFTSIQAAVDASADRDTVLVKDGSFAETVFITNRGLTLIADLGANVVIQGGLRIYGTQASQPILLRGLRVPGTSIANPYGLVVHLAAGAVWVEDCVLHGSASLGGPGLGAAVSDSAGVTFVRCELRGGSGLGKGNPPPGGSGLSSNGPVHVFDSDVRGGDVPAFTGVFFFGTTSSGGAGVQLNGGALFASGTVIVGGTGSSGYAHPLFGCIGGGPGGAGIAGVGPGTSAVLVGTAPQGGSGGPAFGACAQGLAGAPTWLVGGGVTALFGSAHSAQFTAPIREGQAIAGTLHGAPGEFAVLAIAPTLHSGTLLLQLSGVALLGGPISVLGMGQVPASGVIAVTGTAAPLTGGNEGATIATQPAFIDPLALTAALGAPASLTLLKAGL